MAKNITLKDGRELTCRRLKKGDEVALRAFNEGLSKTSKVLFSPHAYDQSTLAKVVQRAEAGEDLVYTLWDDKAERIVGYFFLWWYSTAFPVLGIGISDAYQNQGIGKQLMDILIAEACAAGCSGVELTTIVDNKRAYALYEKMGFKCLGQVDNETGDGRRVKEWHMLYPLKSGAVPPPRKHGPPV